MINLTFQCLKESVIKATGIGMHKNLSDLDFRVKIDDRYRPDKNITSTELVEDGTLRDDWVFEESFLDKTHCVAVCRKVSSRLGSAIWVRAGLTVRKNPLCLGSSQHEFAFPDPLGRCESS